MKDFTYDKWHRKIKALKCSKCGRVKSKSRFLKLEKGAEPICRVCASVKSSKATVPLEKVTCTNCGVTFNRVVGEYGTECLVCAEWFCRLRGMKGR